MSATQLSEAVNFMSQLSLHDINNLTTFIDLLRHNKVIAQAKKEIVDTLVQVRQFSETIPSHLTEILQPISETDGYMRLVSYIQQIYELEQKETIEQLQAAINTVKDTVLVAGDASEDGVELTNKPTMAPIALVPQTTDAIEETSTSNLKVTVCTFLGINAKRSFINNIVTLGNEFEPFSTYPPTSQRVFIQHFCSLLSKTSEELKEIKDQQPKHVALKNIGSKKFEELVSLFIDIIKSNQTGKEAQAQKLLIEISEFSSSATPILYPTKQKSKEEDTKATNSNDSLGSSKPNKEKSKQGDTINTVATSNPTIKKLIFGSLFKPEDRYSVDLFVQHYGSQVFVGKQLSENTKKNYLSQFFALLNNNDSEEDIQAVADTYASKVLLSPETFRGMVSEFQTILGNSDISGRFTTFVEAIGSVLYPITAAKTTTTTVQQPVHNPKEDSNKTNTSIGLKGKIVDTLANGVTGKKTAKIIDMYSKQLFTEGYSQTKTPEIYRNKSIALLEKSKEQLLELRKKHTQISTYVSYGLFENITTNLRTILLDTKLSAQHMVKFDEQVRLVLEVFYEAPTQQTNTQQTNTSKLVAGASSNTEQGITTKGRSIKHNTTSSTAKPSGPNLLKPSQIKLTISYDEWSEQAQSYIVDMKSIFVNPESQKNSFPWPFLASSDGEYSTMILPGILKDSKESQKQKESFLWIMKLSDDISRAKLKRIVPDTDYNSLGLTLFNSKIESFIEVVEGMFKNRSNHLDDYFNSELMNNHIRGVIVGHIKNFAKQAALQLYDTKYSRIGVPSNAAQSFKKAEVIATGLEYCWNR